MTQTFKVTGMSCGHCVRAITEALKAVDAAADVHANLAAGTVTVDSTVARATLAEAIREAGYDLAAA